MRKLVVTENITLDGVIDLSEGWFDPLNEDVDQSDITAASSEHQEAADALLVGRNTFEMFREFWPKQTDDPTGVAAYVFPLVVGRGARLLETADIELTLLETRPFVSGAVLLRYAAIEALTRWRDDQPT